jgi:hypothetical protein
MFRQYRVILREIVINNLQSYTTIKRADVGNTTTINMFYASSLIIIV